MAIAISHITMAGALVSYGADAGRDSSLTDSKNEKEAAATTSAPSASPQLSISPSEVTQLLSQKEELRRQLSLTEQTVQTLTSSLAESNAEAELFRRKFADLELRMEALGLASASKDRAKLEQRLRGCGWWMCASVFAARSFRNLGRRKLRWEIDSKSMLGQM